MFKFVRNVGVVAVVTLLTVLGLSTWALVQSATAAETQTITAHGGGGRGVCGTAGLEAAAEALGMTTDEVSTQLRAGESLADLAEEAGVDTQTVLDAVDAACQAAQREAIEQAVTDGTLTRDKADWLLEGLDKGYWGGSHGSGFGPHGFGGGFNRPPGNKPVPSTDTSTGDA